MRRLCRTKKLLLDHHGFFCELIYPPQPQQRIGPNGPFLLRGVMTTTQRISKEFSEDTILSKMRPVSYAGWKRREAEAKRRAEELKRKHRV